ncbi:hypothetical protein ACFFGT_06520 [Mucilaginibacter angelicae]|uniref:Uncharacterized protein n=1 Tax=Mucilaginibacter angelicae TaxID=869718 RepID=A0ABV6L285_9SPHI
MKEYIDTLRDDSIYIKLQSDEKFGGAVDVDSLIKALNSLNQSYKNYLSIELSKNDNVKSTTKKGKKELSNFIADSQLLIVDLDFASFGAAITPNIITTHPYSTIKDSLNLKKQSFRDYKNDVFYADYTDDLFLQRITAKYTEEERVEIYKPIIDNLIDTEKFKFFFGSNKKHLKRMSKNVLKNKTLDKLVPKVLLEKNVTKDEDMYIIYVTSSDEMDLFGKKPKFSKILATTKLETPVYPYQLHEIRIDKTVYTFQKTLSANVSFEDEIFFIEYPDLNIEVWGDSRPEAEDAFNFAFQSIIKNIYLEKTKA